MQDATFMEMEGKDMDIKAKLNNYKEKFIYEVSKNENSAGLYLRAGLLIGTVAVFATHDFILGTNEQAAGDAFHRSVNAGSSELAYGIRDGLIQKNGYINSALDYRIQTMREDRERVDSKYLGGLYHYGFDGALSGEFDEQDLSGLSSFIDEYPDVMDLLSKEIMVELIESGASEEVAMRTGIAVTMQAVFDAGDSPYDVSSIDVSYDDPYIEERLESITSWLEASMAPQFNAGMTSKSDASYINEMSRIGSGRLIPENYFETYLKARSDIGKDKRNLATVPWNKMEGPPYSSPLSKAKEISRSDLHWSSVVNMPEDDAFISYPSFSKKLEGAPLGIERDSDTTIDNNTEQNSINKGGIADILLRVSQRFEVNSKAQDVSKDTDPEDESPSL